MNKLEFLRDYLHEEIGNLVSAVYNPEKTAGPGPSSDCIRIWRRGCCVCSIYRNKSNYGSFTVVFYDHFICRSAGYSSVVDLTVAQIPVAIKNRIDICENGNRIDVNVSDNTVAKEIYMMSARGSGKTQYVSDLMKNAFRFNPIKDVILNDPATIVFWIDGSKTVVKCQKGETFDPEKGLAMAISKKFLGNDYGYYETFAKYVGRYNKKHADKLYPDCMTKRGTLAINQSQIANAPTVDAIVNTREEIRDKMFFINEKNSNQPVAVIRVADICKNYSNREAKDEPKKSCINCKYHSDKNGIYNCTCINGVCGLDFKNWEAKDNG